MPVICCILTGWLALFDNERILTDKNIFFMLLYLFIKKHKFLTLDSHLKYISLFAFLTFDSDFRKKIGQGFSLLSLPSGSYSGVTHSR